MLRSLIRGKIIPAWIIQRGPLILFIKLGIFSLIALYLFVNSSSPVLVLFFVVLGVALFIPALLHAITEKRIVDEEDIKKKVHRGGNGG